MPYNYEYVAGRLYEIFDILSTIAALHELLDVKAGGDVCGIAISIKAYNKTEGRLKATGGYIACS